MKILILIILLFSANMLHSQEINMGKFDKIEYYNGEFGKFYVCVCNHPTDEIYWYYYFEIVKQIGKETNRFNKYIRAWEIDSEKSISLRWCDKEFDPEYQGKAEIILEIQLELNKSE